MNQVGAVTTATLIATLVAAGCGGQRGGQLSKTIVGSPNVVVAGPPATLTPAERSTFRAGETVIGEQGCLACHAIGKSGNDGPGPSLTHVGAALRPSQIEAVLRNPSDPMPSFAALAHHHPGKFRELVYFLTELR
jgi:menaquinol-cytochrome c reductase cytochrome b/c subunit